LALLTPEEIAESIEKMVAQDVEIWATAAWQEATQDV